MSVMPVMPRDARDWTVADLESLPDDGLQYELLDGILLVSPAPVKIHQVVIAELYAVLRVGCPPDLLVLFAPLDWQPDQRTSLQPDLMVVRNEKLHDKNITESPVLAVEVLSPSTRPKDLVWKRNKYEAAGVRCYWTIDPAIPSITALELVDGAYATVGEAKGRQTLPLDRPFPVAITPAGLISP
jgi:Uma2 family endonuclease